MSKANIKDTAFRLLSRVEGRQEKEGSSGAKDSIRLVKTEEEEEPNSELLAARTLSSWRDAFSDNSDHGTTAALRSESKPMEVGPTIGGLHVQIMTKMEGDRHSETASSPTPGSSANPSEAHSTPSPVSPMSLLHHDAGSSSSNRNHEEEPLSFHDEMDGLAVSEDAGGKMSGSSARRKRRQAKRFVNYEQSLRNSNTAILSINTREPRIYQGAKFSSFAEFEVAFESWKELNFHPFRVASSETLKVPHGGVYETFRYRYIVYHCSHYGEPRMRGNGKRPNQNYLPCGCEAKLRMNFNFQENLLRITSLNEYHNHENTAESYHRATVKSRRQSKLSPTDSISSHATSSSTAITSLMNSPVLPGQTSLDDSQFIGMEHDGEPENGAVKMEQRGIHLLPHEHRLFPSLAQAVNHSSPAMTTTSRMSSSSSANMKVKLPITSHQAVTSNGQSHSSMELKNMTKLLEFLTQQEQQGRQESSAQPRLSLPNSSCAQPTFDNGSSSISQHATTSRPQLDNQSPVSSSNRSLSSQQQQCQQLLLPMLQGFLDLTPKSVTQPGSTQAAGEGNEPSTPLLAEILTSIDQQPKGEVKHSSVRQPAASSEHVISAHSTDLQKLLAERPPAKLIVPVNLSQMLAQQRGLAPTSLVGGVGSLFQQQGSSIRSNNSSTTSRPLLQALALCSESEKKVLEALFEEAKRLIQYLEEYMLTTNDLVSFIAQLREVVVKLFSEARS